MENLHLEAAEGSIVADIKLMLLSTEMLLIDAEKLLLDFILLIIDLIVLTVIRGSTVFLLIILVTEKQFLDWVYWAGC